MPLSKVWYDAEKCIIIFITLDSQYKSQRILLHNFINHLSVHGKWGSWAEFGPCTGSCGKGTQMRARECNNPKPSVGGLECNGLMSTENRACELPTTCPPKSINNIYWMFFSMFL